MMKDMELTLDILLTISPTTPRQEYYPYSRPFDYLSTNKKVKYKYDSVKVKEGKVVHMLN
jgi:hypothetical protein